MSTLVENVSSDYLRLISYFGHTPARENILVLVEGDEDIPFWQQILSKYSGRYQFDVATGKMRAGLKANGKHVLLQTANLSKNKILCIDADFDLLIDNYSADTAKVRTDAYVFSTVYHSQESIKADSLNTNPVVSRMSGGQPTMLNYASFIATFSEAIYSRLLDFLVELQGSADNVPGSHPLRNVMTKFIQDISAIKLLPYGNGSAAAYAATYSAVAPAADRAAMDARLKSLGITKSTCYKSVRGHNLMNGIVLPVISHEVSRCRNLQYAAARKHNPSLTLRQFNQTLGNHPTLLVAIRHEMLYCPIDPSSVPAQLRNRLDAMYL